ncbi:hypothetical protein [Haloarcula sp. JP-L23]|uniref:hypothetical protein n=1 Tax=Haloarcula sp. JP-L23 TaxID=2716717 RepID=UPI001D03FFC8
MIVATTVSFFITSFVVPYTICHQTHDDWTLDAVLADAEGVPPTVLRELALADLTLRPTPSQAGHQHVVATA